MILKNSAALFELCDGLRVQLTKCRRSDDILFNMLLPENIEKIKRDDFNNMLTDRHLSFTNDKRIAINEMMMLKYIKQKNYKKRLILINYLTIKTAKICDY